MPAIIEDNLGARILNDSVVFFVEHRRDHFRTKVSISQITNAFDVGGGRQGTRVTPAPHATTSTDWVCGGRAEMYVRASVASDIARVAGRLHLPAEWKLRTPEVLSSRRPTR